MPDISPRQRAGNTKIHGADAANQETNSVKAYDFNELGVADILSGDGDNAQKVIGTSAVLAAVTSSNRPKRKTIRIENDGNTLIYWGYNSSTSSSGVNKGHVIYKRAWVDIAASETANIYIVSDSAGGSVVISEGVGT